MTTVNILITVLLTTIVLAAFLYWWLIKHFASMSKEEKKIYDKELAKKALDEIELRDKLKEIAKNEKP